jgi:hypothetical protein
MKILVSISIIFLLFGCKNPEESTVKTSNASFELQKLFEHDGCSVYRFYDGRSIYYTTCIGSTQTRYSCGKHCIRDDNVETAEGM